MIKLADNELPFYQEGEYFGDWLATPKEPIVPKFIELPIIPEWNGFTESLTPNAVQQYWRTPSEFLCCPQQDYTQSPILAYAEQLKLGAIFCRNELYRSTVADIAVSTDGATIWVLCSISSVVKSFALAQITFQDEQYIHTSLGTFFSWDGASKQLCLAQGLEWNGNDSVDDYC